MKASRLKARGPITEVQIIVTANELVLKSTAQELISGYLKPVQQQVGRNFFCDRAVGNFTLSKAGHEYRIDRDKIGTKRAILVLTRPAVQEQVVKLA